MISTLRLYTYGQYAYTLTFTAIQPFYGQAADFFGRKVVLAASIIMFLLGSGLCGGAFGTQMLIAGRAVQGLGGGGLSILPAMVVCDLVPLRERQKYIGIIYGAFAIGTFIGPILGGSLVDTIGWRWIFWLNLPVSGAALGLILLFLRLERGRSHTSWQLLARVDYTGNVLLIASITATLISLSWAGTTYSWGPWRTLLPLLLGFLGLIMFILFEAMPCCREPIMPLRLFKNRTSSTAFLLTFLHGIILYWVSYFFPAYCQAVLQASSEGSGIDTLAGVITMVPFGIIGGVFTAKTGRYKPNQIVGFGLAAIGIGCFSILDETSPTVTWILLQIVFATGAGLVLTSTLPAIQGLLPEADVAVATATWGFIQSLGFVWGAAIPSSIFNTRFSSLAHFVSDAAARQTLETGGAYEHATQAFVSSLPATIRTQVISIFVSSLTLVYAGPQFQEYCRSTAQSQSQYRYNTGFRDFRRDWNCAGIPGTFTVNPAVPVLSFYLRNIYKSCDVYVMCVKI